MMPDFLRNFAELSRYANKPEATPVLPPVIIASQYDNSRVASIAFNETSQLLNSQTSKRGLLCEIKFALGRMHQETYVNVLMSQDLGEELQRQARSILFRRGREFVVDNRNRRYYEGKLQDAWRDFISQQKSN